MPAGQGMGWNVQAVSKQVSMTSRTTIAYWKKRLFRGSYSRDGRLHLVRGWRVKVQVRGRRRTFSLQSTDAGAAAREAMELYRSLTVRDAPNVSGAPVSPSAASPSVPPLSRAGPLSGSGRLRLVRRPHLPEAAEKGSWSVWIEQDGQGHYFPLGAAKASEAARRARRLQAAVADEGLARVLLRQAREATVAIRWCGDPVMWTYFTLLTRPTELPARSRAPARASAARPWRVGILEPDAGLRSAFVDALLSQPECRRVMEWGRSADALGEIPRCPLDFLLVNHSLEGISGAEFLARLQWLAPDLPARVYSVCADSDELFKSTPGGAAGYLLRRTEPNRILEALGGPPSEGLQAGTELLKRIQRCFQQLIGTPAQSGGSAEMSRLTPRELEILSLMAKGFLDKEIARDLRISVWTVHGHAKRIYEKLSVHSRTEAVVKYLQK
ncbi:MAG: hypothetical protein RIS76_397 [Verrucomicrobiota bacterium]